MITSYYRPNHIEEAQTLLLKPKTIPLGGGTWLSRHSDEDFAVVDLQALGLNVLSELGTSLIIGATVTMQELLEYPSSPPPLNTSITLEAPINNRMLGTIAGALVTCDGRSPLAATMLALDAHLTVLSSQSEVFSLVEYLSLRHGSLKNKLIVSIEIPLKVKLAYQSIARSPSDKPIVSVAVAQWESGGTRVVLGGWGDSPTLAFDGNVSPSIESEIRNYAKKGTNGSASSEYREEMSVLLTNRCLNKIFTLKH